MKLNDENEKNMKGCSVMKYGYLIIKVDNSITILESKDMNFTIDELYQAINCNSISLIRRDMYMICCDDDAIARGREFNVIASCFAGCGICGDVVLGVNETNFYFPMVPDIYKMVYADCELAKEFFDNLDLIKL